MHTICEVCEQPTTSLVLRRMPDGREVYACSFTCKPTDPANCRECDAPFNNADAPQSGLCAACEADHYDDELMADAAYFEQVADYEASR